MPSSDGSSACYRWPICNTAAAAVLSLATLDEIQRHNRDDEAEESFPCAKRTLCSPERRDIDVLEHSKQLNADPLGPAEQKQFSTDFRLPCSRVSNASRKGTKQNKNHKLDPTDDKEGIQTHPVE